MFKYTLTILPKSIISSRLFQTHNPDDGDQDIRYKTDVKSIPHCLFMK